MGWSCFDGQGNALGEETLLSLVALSSPDESPLEVLGMEEQTVPKRSCMGPICPIFTRYTGGKSKFLSSGKWLLACDHCLEIKRLPDRQWLLENNVL